MDFIFIYWLLQVRQDMMARETRLQQFLGEFYFQLLKHQFLLTHGAASVCRLALCPLLISQHKTHVVGKLNTEEIHPVLLSGSACFSAIYRQVSLSGSYCHTHMFTSHKWLYFMRSLEKCHSTNEKNVDHWSLLLNIWFSHIGTTKCFTQRSSCFVWNWSVSCLTHIVASPCTYTTTPIISVTRFLLTTY